MTHRQPLGWLFAAGLALLLAVASGCAKSPPGTFATPEEAVQRLASVLGTGNTAVMDELFGPGSSEILGSGDDVADRQDALQVKALIEEKLAFEDLDERTKVALLGNDEWPFPFPLTSDGKRWRFDAAAGKEELANRRVGRNELSTLATLHAAVDAQREYFAARPHGGEPTYAQKFVSAEGQRDGLYWPSAEGESPSPLGDLLASAAAEGYDVGGEPAPYHGYYYRMLTGQGPSAPGGQKSYLDRDGLMPGGFAVVAWPASHGASGVMTFLVDEQGIVFQKDLGADTESAAGAINLYDPDESWAPTGD